MSTLSLLPFDMICHLMSNRIDSYAKISWEAGDTPLSLQFDDPYFARENGRAETQHIFLAANRLPERWHSAPKFTIAELGFGTGLNFIETLDLWLRKGGNQDNSHLTFVSFELYPMTANDMARSLAPWATLQPLVDQLLSNWPPPPSGPAVHRVSFPACTLELYLGDANNTLPDWPGKADAWYLDGFSPAKNPELWNPELMQAIFDHTTQGGTFATYTAAGFVRRNLSAAGFEVSKIPGYGRKRESIAGKRLS